MTPFFRMFLAACVLAIIGFLMSPYANAQEKGLSTIEVRAVGVHVASHHWPQAEWNNSNPGLYVMADVKGPAFLTGSYAVGTYYNSERHQSAYLARVFNVVGPIDVAIGAISGYNRAAVLPLVAPSVKLDVVSGYSARVFVLPKVESTGAWVVHLAVEKRF